MWYAFWCRFTEYKVTYWKRDSKVICFAWEVGGCGLIHAAAAQWPLHILWDPVVSRDHFPMSWKKRVFCLKKLCSTLKSFQWKTVLCDVHFPTPLSLFAGWQVFSLTEVILLHAVDVNASPRFCHHAVTRMAVAEDKSLCVLNHNGWQISSDLHRPATLPPAVELRYPLDRSLGKPQTQWRRDKSLPMLRIEPRSSSL